MKQTKRLLVLVLLCGGLASFGAEVLYDVRDFGAKPDGTTLCTKAIQAAIDKCAAEGGGTVYFPPGRFLTGTLFMKSGVTLRLDNGSTRFGSPDLAQYPVTIPELANRTR